MSVIWCPLVVYLEITKIKFWNPNKLLSGSGNYKAQKDATTIMTVKLNKGCIQL